MLSEICHLRPIFGQIFYPIELTPCRPWRTSRSRRRLTTPPGFPVGTVLTLASSNQCCFCLCSENCGEMWILEVDINDTVSLSLFHFSVFSSRRDRAVVIPGVGVAVLTHKLGIIIPFLLESESHFGGYFAICYTNMGTDYWAWVTGITLLQELQWRQSIKFGEWAQHYDETSSDQSRNAQQNQSGPALDQ